jgi:hypothetical protein
MTPGILAFGDFLGINKQPSIPQIMNMIDNDGTAEALFNVMKFPVQATNWHIEPDPEDMVKNADGTETHPQADFVEACLRNPEHKGGMSTPFSLVLEDILLGVAQGHRFFEIVYKLDEQGRVAFQKVVARDWHEYEIKTDETGGFAGVEQRVKRGNSYEKIRIEVPYCFLYTYNKARNKLKGRSAFRAGYYHYDKKHRLYYLQNQQGQVSAVPMKVLKEPDDSITKEQRDANLSIADALGVRSTVALPFGWELEFQTAGRAVDLSPAIDHQDVQMARAVLAQGMLLGNQTASTGGSYALAESHLDLFMLGEMALMSSIEEHITTYLVAKLYDYNFAQPLYGTFKFEALSDPVETLLREAFKGLVSKGTVPSWVSDGIAKRVAEQMEIEEPDDAGEDDPDEEEDADPKVKGGDTAAQQSRRRAPQRLAKGTWWRELTAPEAKVQFAKIQKDADTAEAKLLTELRPVFDKLSKDATKRLEPLLDDKGVKALDGFTLKFDSEARQVMTDSMLDAYGNAKLAAADEIGVAAPANKQTSKDMIKQHVAAVVEKQYSDMLFQLKTIVTDAVRKNQLAKTELSVSNVLALVTQMFSAYFGDKEDLTASSLITAALNIGRDDVFKDNDGDIYGYQYSAILDDKVCAICEDLDSSVVTNTEYMATVWMPPIHFNCRCIWVAIMDDEEEKPDYSGLPDSPGGATEPSLSRTPPRLR